MLIKLASIKVDKMLWTRLKMSFETFRRGVSLKGFYNILPDIMHLKIIGSANAK